MPKPPVQRLLPIAPVCTMIVVCAMNLSAAHAHDQVVAEDAKAVAIGDVVNTLTFDVVKPGAVGELDVGHSRIVFNEHNKTITIPIAAIQSFSLEHSTRPLLRGMKGTIARFAPEGGGQLYSAIRLGTETLTVLYADQNQALHAAILVLPMRRKDDALRAFESAGLTPTTDLAAGTSSTTPPMERDASAKPAPAPGQKPSILVLLPKSNAQGVPVAFLAGIYEDIVAQLAKSGAYAEVYRQGDVQADPDALTLTVNVTQVKKGSAGTRGAIPVAGMFLGETLIKADVHLTDAFGATLLDRKLQGTKRTPGESMAATRSLAVHVSNALRSAPASASNESGAPELGSPKT